MKILYLKIKSEFFIINQPIDPLVKKFLIPTLRRQWMYWPARQTVLKRCMVDRGNYRCEICKQPGFKRNELQIDHIEPVQVLETKLLTWHDLIIYITRMFVYENKLQGVCLVCHSLKTSLETKMRKFYRDQKKDLDKNKK